MKSTIFAAMASLAFATFAAAEEFAAGVLTIENPHAFATSPTAMAGAGYMTIRNAGSVDDQLLAVEAAFPRVMIHTTEMKDDVAMMMHIDQLSIPAGGEVEFAPGGLHVMFMGIRGTPFVAGDTFPATLVFETAGRVDVVFSIEARGAHDHMGH